MTIDECADIVKAWSAIQENKRRTSWEQVRFLAQCMLSPYSKKKLPPTDIVRFDWDEKEGRSSDKKEVPTTADIERIRKMFGDS